jgi:uncharacterized membrane protein YdjX (TVP38/TMEM64 family)
MPRKAKFFQPAVLLVAAIVLIAGALSALWAFAPVSELTDPKVVGKQLVAFAGSAWAPFVIIAAFLAASAVFFPINVLMAGAAAAFGPWLGLAYAALGALTSALAAYAIGRWIGKRFVRELLGERLTRIRKRVVRHGIVSVAAIRLVPVAPFTVVNLAAGASEIALLDYMIGSMLGLAPGLVVMAFLGDQLAEVLSNPTGWNVALLAAAVGVWIAIMIGAQIAATKRLDRKA